MVYSVVGVIGVLSSVLAVDRPEEPYGWVLLAVGSVAAGVLTGMAVVGAEAGRRRSTGTRPDNPVIEFIKKIVSRMRGWSGTAPLVITAILAAVAVAVVGGPSLVTVIWPPACPQPVELRVLTSPDQLSAMQTVARAYERARVDDRRCPTANLYVYALPVREATEALENGWPRPVLERWPRPDVWLAESEFAAGEGQRVRPWYTMDPPELVAMTPVVLGLPADLEPPWPAGYPSLTLAQMLRSARETGWGFVRPNPDASAAGLHALAAVLESHGGATPAVNLLEREIARTMDGGSYRVDDEADVDVVMRQYHSEVDGSGDSAPPSTIVITTEQALVRHESLPSGRCPDRRDDLAVRAYYPSDTVHVELQFVQVAWHDTVGSPQREVAQDFQDWLRNDERGWRALTEVGLRPHNQQRGGIIDANCGADPDRSAGSAPSQARLTSAAGYRSPLRGRLLLLLDTSRSMREVVAVDDEADGGEGGASRLSLAVDAVRGALGQMTSRDELGVWEFPGETGVVGELVALQPAPGPGGDPGYRDRVRRQVDDVLDEVTADGRGTPLFAAIRAGIEEVALAGDDSGDESGEVAKALVVISDGEDSAGGQGADELVEIANLREVRILVLAVGELTCASNNLLEVARATGGDCREATPATLHDQLRRLVSGVWGGPDER